MWYNKLSIRIEEGKKARNSRRNERKRRAWNIEQKMSEISGLFLTGLFLNHLKKIFSKFGDICSPETLIWITALLIRLFNLFVSFMEHFKSKFIQNLLSKRSCCIDVNINFVSFHVLILVERHIVWFSDFGSLKLS